MLFADAAQDFLAQPRIAIVGVSRKPGHASRGIFRKLRGAGREIFPVNPAAGEIEGVRCYPDLRSIPGGVAAVFVVTRRTAMPGIVRECAELGIRHVWLHGWLGGGEVSEEMRRLARAADLVLIPGGCPMMVCAPVDLAHRCLHGCLRALGRLPATI